ncbi:hypothetical protein DL96DRAFT_162025 [Flagelloscypha sp. PMI_526]|nr:hypothetical protein DL96DRAFT_162025 [Flagelloscypha sp. PMI_526]
MQPQQEQEPWYESFDAASDDEFLHEDYPSFVQNLGADSPFHQYFGSGLASRSSRPQTPLLSPHEVSAPAKQRIWRSLSFDRKKRVLASNRRESKSRSPSVTSSPLVEKDCGICFDVARKPASTTCCGSIFCYEHISDWLSAFGSAPAHCPSCTQPCSLALQVRRLPTSSRASHLSSPLISTLPNISVPPLPADILSTPLQARPMSSLLSPIPISSPPSYHEAPDYDSDTSEFSSRDDSQTSGQDDSEVITTSKRASGPSEHELLGKFFTLVALTLVLCLIFNKQAAIDTLHVVEPIA